MSNPPRRKVILPIVLFLTLFLVGIGLVIWTAISSPALGLISQPATATPGKPFALVTIKKPTIPPTALPVALPTAFPTSSPIPVILPTEIPTLQTSESLVYAEIVADTPTPVGYSNTSQYDAPPSYTGNKYILVDISEQHMYVYDGDALINNFVSSTGMNNATRAGNFSVLDKIPNAYGATWDIWMPNWLGIYWAGSMENGIHALPILSNGATLWAGYLGVPISYGCVVLGTYDAQWLYDWADIGTPVEIRW